MEDNEDAETDLSTVFIPYQGNIARDNYITHHFTATTENTRRSLTTSVIFLLPLKRTVLLKLPMKRHSENTSDYPYFVEIFIEAKFAVLKAVHIISPMLNNGDESSDDRKTLSMGI